MTRSYLASARLEHLAAELSERDQAILRTLATVRLASGAQLERLHFAHVDPRNRRRGLTSLVDKTLLDRLPRLIGGVRAGSAGYLYTLGPAGQRLLAWGAGSRGQRGRRPWVPGWAFVAHALAVTELYVELVEARRGGRIELFNFQGEPSCWRTFHGPGGGRAILKPDARVCVVQGEFERHYFIEVDRGTESAAAIERKLKTYRAYWSSGREQVDTGVFPWVLFVVPGKPRQRQLLEVLGKVPEDSRGLFRVTTAEQAVGAITGERS